MKIKTWILGIIILCGSFNAFSQPQLIDINIIGTAIEPDHLQLYPDQDYLLVITNQNTLPFIFHYDKFGQDVFTHYLSGASHVQQDSITLPPNGKISWHFVTQKEGEYVFYALNSQLNQKSREGKIIIGVQKKNETSVEGGKSMQPRSSFPRSPT